MGGWTAVAAADPHHDGFSIDAAQATFTSAGFTRIAEEHYAWGAAPPGTGRPCARFERNGGVTVVGHRPGYEVAAA